MGVLRGTGRLGAKAIGAVGGSVVGAAKFTTATALQTSGVSPLLSVLGSGIGRSGGSLFGSKRGRGGGSSKSETGLLNTSLLFQIRDEVQQIKGLLVATAIPESERREKEFDEARRHRELLAAISTLGGGMGGPAASAKSGGLAKLLLGLLALTGLAMLPKLLENIPSIVDGIQSFLEQMGLFLAGMWGAFKLLGARTRAMKPPSPKTVLTADNKKTAAKKKAAEEKRAKKAAEKKAKADAKRADRNKRRVTGRRWTNPLRRMLGGKTIAQEKLSTKPARLQRGSVGFAPEEGMAEKAAAERARAAEAKRQRAASEKIRLDGVRERLQIQKQKIIDGKAARNRQLSQERRDNVTERKNSLEKRAQTVARNQARALQLGIKGGATPNTAAQNRLAILQDAKTVARLEVRNLTSRVTGTIADLYDRVRLTDIRRQLLSNSIQKGMGGLMAPEGVSRASTVKTPTVRTTITGSDSVRQGGGG